MKKFFCFLLALTFLLTGCGSVDQGEKEDSASQLLTPVELETAPMAGNEGGLELAFANPGKIRILYQGNLSYVKYITSVEQLPDTEVLADYDAAFFETKALLIVVETVSSGSVQLELDAIRVSDGNASVCVKRTMSGDAGTTDMATWMLWAEVDRGLEYTWTLANSTNLPAGEKY